MLPLDQGGQCRPQSRIRVTLLSGARDGVERKICLGWGEGGVHVTSVQGLFGVVDHGHHVVGYFVKEALQVRVDVNLDSILT